MFLTVTLSISFLKVENTSLLLLRVFWNSSNLSAYIASCNENTHSSKREKQKVKLIWFARRARALWCHADCLSVLKSDALITYSVPAYRKGVMENLIFCYIITRKCRGTQRQFSENICSEDDMRSRIFGTLFCRKISCLPASPRIFEHLKNCIIAHF